MKEQRNMKKLNNKGFSLVEIIIVIAIMAILAGAVAPQLIKYIDKSRKAADIQAAQTIASAVNVALADEDGYDDAVSGSGKLSAYFPKSTDNDFRKIVFEILGSEPKLKYKKDGNTDFYILMDSERSIKIYAHGGTTDPTSADDKNLLYPSVGSNFK